MELLGLLLGLALIRICENIFFKFIVVIYLIHLGVTSLSFLNVICVSVLWKNGMIVFTIFNILSSYSAMFHGIATAVLLVYAVFTYRESHIFDLKV